MSCLLSVKKEVLALHAKLDGAWRRPSSAKIPNISSPRAVEKQRRKDAKRDKKLAGTIEDEMFTFADLITVEPKDLGTIMRSVDNTQLVPALKGADEKLRAKILGCMSSRAAQTLEDEMNERGPMPMSEVIEAQKSVVAQARRLADSGDVVIGGGGDDYV